MRDLVSERGEQPSSDAASLVLGQDVQFGQLERLVEPVRCRLGRHRLAYQVVPPLAGLGRVAVAEAEEHAVVVQRGPALEPVVLGVPSRRDCPLRPGVVGVAHRQDVDVHGLVDARGELSAGPPLDVRIADVRLLRGSHASMVPYPAATA